MKSGEDYTKCKHTRIDSERHAVAQNDEQDEALEVLVVHHVDAGAPNWMVGHHAAQCPLAIRAPSLRSRLQLNKRIERNCVTKEPSASRSSCALSASNSAFCSSFSLWVNQQPAKGFSAVRRGESSDLDFGCFRLSPRFSGLRGVEEQRRPHRPTHGVSAGK